MSDAVLAALDDLVAALKENDAAIRVMLKRAEAVRRARAKGLPYRDIVRTEERPLIVELLSGNQERLATAGSRFRRAEAAALRAEGLTLDEIARLFGVTRQRVIALLKDAQGR